MNSSPVLTNITYLKVLLLETLSFLLKYVCEKVWTMDWVVEASFIAPIDILAGDTGYLEDFIKHLNWVENYI